MRVQAAPHEHFAWIQARTGCTLTPDARAIEALDASGFIRGMVVYDSWTENACQTHLALDEVGAARALLYPAFEYPFVQCNRRTLWGIVPASNQKALNLELHLGFVECFRLKEGYRDGVDLVFLELRREDCRFLKQDKRRAA